MAVYVFTQLNRIVIRALQAEIPGIKVIAYIDDFLFALSRRDVPAMLQSVAILRSFGFLVNLDKCDLLTG